MTDVRIKIDTREVKAAIQALRKEGPKAIADALNRTAFEILDAEAVEVKGALNFASPSTERFLSRGFQFEKATPDHLAVTVFARQGSRPFLERQALGVEVAAGEPDVGPRLGAEIAVPVNVPRGARGKIAAARLPGRLLKKNARGRSRAFVAGKAVLERVGGGVRLLYALTLRVKIPKRVDFHGVAERTAREQFPKKAHRVLEKLNLRRRS